MIVLSGFAVVMYLIGKYHMQFPPPNSEAYIEGEGMHDVMVSVGHNTINNISPIRICWL